MLSLLFQSTMPNASAEGSNLKVANLEHKGRGLWYCSMQWQTLDMEGRGGESHLYSGNKMREVNSKGSRGTKHKVQPEGLVNVTMTVAGASP
jgi:hypothetical protein